MLKLGVNTVLFKPFTVGEAMKAVKLAGYDGVELSAIAGMCEHLVLDDWENSAPPIKAAAEELDLKKCAQAAGEKKIEMIHVKDLLGLTGYIRGGCSPIGMKKKFPTTLDETAILFDKIYVSAGQRGVQVILNPEDLANYIGADYADLTKR